MVFIKEMLIDRGISEAVAGVQIVARQLAPNENGIPIEIYAFTTDIDFKEYEESQADIFDHLFAVVSEFQLRVFQNPSGYDIKQISKIF